MYETTSQSSHHQPTRRQAIRMLAGGIAALAAGACAPATILLKTYPDEYRVGTAATERALRAFTETVVPGLTPAELDAVTVLQDPFYPMAKYSAYLASDLDHRAKQRYDRPFAALTAAERASVLDRALQSRGVTLKLYTGAVFLTQAAVYGGIHDDRAGCRLIDFPGGYQLTAQSRITSAGALTPLGVSADGNPA